MKIDRHGFIRCRVCGCTQIDACPGGCGWAYANLCTICDQAAQALVTWMQDSRRPMWEPLKREALRQGGATVPNVSRRALLKRAPARRKTA